MHILIQAYNLLKIFNDHIGICLNLMSRTFRNIKIIKLRQHNLQAFLSFKVIYQHKKIKFFHAMSLISLFGVWNKKLYKRRLF